MSERMVCIVGFFSTWPLRKKVAYIYKQQGKQWLYKVTKAMRIKRQAEGYYFHSQQIQTIHISGGSRGGGAESAAAPPFFGRFLFFWPILADFLARHRGIWIPGPPFSQILDPPLHIHMYVPGEIKIHDDSERSLASLAFYK